LRKAEDSKAKERDTKELKEHTLKNEKSAFHLLEAEPRKGIRKGGRTLKGKTLGESACGPGGKIRNHRHIGGEVPVGVSGG